MAPFRTLTASLPMALALGLAVAACFAPARAGAEPAPPPVEATPLPAGTLPLYVADPVLPDDPGAAPGFGCFQACGPSCACAGRVDGQTTTTTADGRTCTWKTIQCNTHSFCKWHDGCYLRCDDQYPGHVSDGSVGRDLCYRSCDSSCISGADPGPVGGWRPASLDPGPPPEALGVVACAERILNPNSSSVPYDGTLTYAELAGCTAAP